MTPFFQVFTNDFDSYCKDLTQKDKVSFKAELVDVVCFYSEVQELFMKNWCMKNFFFQVKCHFKVKLKSFFSVVSANTIRFPSEKHWTMVFIFFKKFKVLLGESDGFVSFYDKQFQSLIQRVLIKESKGWNKSSRNSWVGYIRQTATEQNIWGTSKETKT